MLFAVLDDGDMLGQIPEDMGLTQNSSSSLQVMLLFEPERPYVLFLIVRLPMDSAIISAACLSAAVK